MPNYVNSNALDTGNSTIDNKVARLNSFFEKHPEKKPALHTMPDHPTIQIYFCDEIRAALLNEPQLRKVQEDLQEDFDQNHELKLLIRYVRKEAILNKEEKKELIEKYIKTENFQPFTRVVNSIVPRAESLKEAENLYLLYNIKPNLGSVIEFANFCQNKYQATALIRKYHDLITSSHDKSHQLNRLFKKLVTLCKSSEDVETLIDDLGIRPDPSSINTLLSYYDREKKQIPQYERTDTSNPELTKIVRFLKKHQVTLSPNPSRKEIDMVNQLLILCNSVQESEQILREYPLVPDVHTFRLVMRLTRSWEDVQHVISTYQDQYGIEPNMRILNGAIYHQTSLTGALNFLKNYPNHTRDIFSYIRLFKIALNNNNPKMAEEYLTHIQELDPEEAHTYENRLTNYYHTPLVISPEELEEIRLDEQPSHQPSRPSDMSLSEKIKKFRDTLRNSLGKKD